MRPDVSIVVPTFNRERDLLRAVGSCRQPGVRVEVLVVDDGSDDGTVQALEKEFAGLTSREGVPGNAAGTGRSTADPIQGNFGDFRIRYRRQSRQGACAARNLGLALATGTAVKFLDDDDELIPGVLQREVDALRRSGSDVVLTGWVVKHHDSDGREVTGSRREFPAPHLERGIDDVLLRRGPWTAAALYRRSSVAHLVWEAGRADDWVWAVSVCLSGARFHTLDEPSAYYIQHDRARLTSAGDPFLESTRVRQRVLRRIEEHLSAKGELNASRRQALAQYYCVDACVICERDRREWERLWNHCAELAPGFRYRPEPPALRPLVRCLGGRRGVELYVALRAAARKAGLGRS